MGTSVEEMVSNIKNIEILECCEKPSVRLCNILANRNIRTIYELSKIKDEEDFCRGVVGRSAGWAFNELKEVLESMNLSFGMTDESWEVWTKKNTRENHKTDENDESEDYEEYEDGEETDVLSRKNKSLKKLLSCLIENFEACYVIDGNMDEMKTGRLSLAFEGEGDNTKLILKSEGNQIFAGELKDYYIDQCRGGGSSFLFRNLIFARKKIEIRFNEATRFYEEYKDKKLGKKVQKLAEKYYNIWKYEHNCCVRYWNPSQFGYED